MRFSAGHNLAVEMTRTKEKGSPWIVRILRKRLLFTRVEATDWFLDEPQAQRYAEAVARELRGGASLDIVRNRKPGWVLASQRPRD